MASAVRLNQVGTLHVSRHVAVRSETSCPMHDTRRDNHRPIRFKETQHNFFLDLRENSNVSIRNNNTFLVLALGIVPGDKHSSTPFLRDIAVYRLLLVAAGAPGPFPRKRKLDETPPRADSKTPNVCEPPQTSYRDESR